MTYTALYPTVATGSPAAVFAARFRAAVAQHGHTPETLAPMLGIHADQLRNYIANLEPWDIEAAYDAATVLGVELVDMLTLTPSPSDMTLPVLRRWLNRHYGGVVKVSDVIDRLVDLHVAPAAEQWTDLVFQCDKLAIQRREDA